MPHTAPRSPDPASPLLFVINGASGHHHAEETRQRITAALAEAGRTGEFLMCRPEELARTARGAAADALARCTAVVAVGGDGTINAVAQAAHAAGCAMGVLPQGTFNYFARTHGIPDVPEAALAMLLSGQPQAVQVGLINDQVFLVNASLGLYPDLLQDREAYKARFGRSRLVAFGAGLATLLGRHRLLRLHIDHGTQVHEVRTTTLFVGNNRLQLEQVGLEQADAPAQGHLAAIMLQPIGVWAMLRLILHGAMGNLGEAGTVHSFRFHRISVKLRHPWGRRVFKVAYDGEVGHMRAPLEFRVAPTPLYLLKPPPEDPAQGVVAVPG